MVKSSKKPATKFSNHIQGTLRCFDIFGEEFRFNVNGENTFKTLVGGTISIAFLAVFGFTFFSALKKLFDTTNPAVSISSMTTLEVPVMDLFENNLSIAFSGFISPSILKSEHLLRYFTPIASILELKANSESADYDFVPNLVRSIQFVPCRDLKSKRIAEYYKISEIENDLYNNYSLCPDIDDSSEWKVLGRLSSPPIRFIQISIYPCILASGCVDIDTLRQFTF